MGKQITIEYQRDGTTYSGTVKRPSSTPDAVDETLHFTGWEFRQIVNQLHRWMVEDPAEQLVWIRRDIPPHTPYYLEEEMVKKIHLDPVAAIRAMTPAPIRVDVRDRTKMSLKPAGLQIRTGHDTLADSFGDFIYLHASSGNCLKCGSPGHAVQKGVSIWVCTNSSCMSLMVVVPTDDPNWVRVWTETVLNTDWNRFYITHPWNPTPPWISRADLLAKYETFKQERRACSKQEA